MKVRALLTLALVCGCKETPTGSPPAPLAQVSIPIQGRVLDEQDAGIAGVQVLVFSSSDQGLPATRLQVLSDAEGFFSGAVTSTPMVVSVAEGPAGYEFPGTPHAIDGGLGIEVRGRRIPH